MHNKNEMLDIIEKNIMFAEFIDTMRNDKDRNYYEQLLKLITSMKNDIKENIVNAVMNNDVDRMNVKRGALEFVNYFLNVLQNSDKNAKIRLENRKKLILNGGK